MPHPPYYTATVGSVSAAGRVEERVTTPNSSVERDGRTTPPGGRVEERVTTLDSNVERDSRTFPRGGRVEERGDSNCCSNDLSSPPAPQGE